MANRSTLMGSLWLECVGSVRFVLRGAIKLLGDCGCVAWISLGKGKSPRIALCADTWAPEFLRLRCFYIRLGRGYTSAAAALAHTTRATATHAYGGASHFHSLSIEDLRNRVKPHRC